MTEQVISPLRRRMIEDMTIRKFAAKTQHDYVQRVKEFAAFLGRSPDTARAQDVRRFQLHLTSSGAGTPKINAAVSALRFFFNVTLERADLAKPLASLRQERKAPAILSPEEVARFTLSSPAFNDNAMLPLKYAGGVLCGKDSRGGNISPPLAWADPLALIKSFAVLMIDPDGRRGIGSVHWVACGIPSARTVVERRRGRNAAGGGYHLWHELARSIGL